MSALVLILAFFTLSVGGIEANAAAPFLNPRKVLSEISELAVRQEVVALKVQPPDGIYTVFDTFYISVPTAPGLTRYYSIPYSAERQGRFSIDQTGSDIGRSPDGSVKVKLAYIPSAGSGTTPANPDIGQFDLNWWDLDYSFTVVNQGVIPLSASSYVAGPRDPENSCRAIGSIIGLSEQTLGEFVPIVGTGFSLAYTSANSTAYGGSKLPHDTARSFNKGGWNPSIHHYFSNARLFKGSGEVISARAHRFTNEYLVAETDPSEIYVFDLENKHTETRDAVTGKVIYRFRYNDLTGLLSSVADGAGKTTTFERDSNGFIVKIVSPYGKISIVEVNASGLYSSVTSPGGKKYEFTYKEGTSLLVSFTKPGGQTSYFSYDETGRLTRDLGAGGNYWDLIRVGSVVTQRSALGVESSLSRISGSSGGVGTTITDASGAFGSFSEGAGGNISAGSSVGSLSTVVTPDSRSGVSFNRTKSVSLTVPSLGSRTIQVDQAYLYPEAMALSSRHAFNYSKLDRTITSGDRVQSFSYDSSASQLTATSAEGIKLKIIYNDNSKPISIQLGSDVPRSFIYDNQGRLTNTFQGERGGYSYSYNAAGLVDSVTDLLGQVTAYQYDTDNHLIKTNLADGREISFSYDDNGNLTSISPPGRAAHSYLWNAMELISSYLPPNVAGVPDSSTEYTYDLDKRVTKIRRPNGSNLSMSYSPTTGFISSVSGSDGSSKSYGYIYGSNLVNSILTQDGAVSLRESFEYFGNVPKSLEYRRENDGLRIGKISFGYDSNHRRTFRMVEGRSASSSRTIDYVLDRDDRPTRVGSMLISYAAESGRPSGTAIGSIKDSYVYDSFGRLTGYHAKFDSEDNESRAIYSYALDRDVTGRIVRKLESVLGVETCSAQQNNYRFLRIAER